MGQSHEQPHEQTRFEGMAHFAGLAPRAAFRQPHSLANISSLASFYAARTANTAHGYAASDLGTASHDATR